MKKKNLAKMLSCMLALAMMPLSACGGDKTQQGGTIRFWSYGDLSTKSAYSAMVDKYNKTQGKTDGIVVSYSHKPESGYDTQIAQNAAAKTGPDVFAARDLYFKSWVAQGYVSNLNSFVTESVNSGTLDMDEIYPNALNRFRYNKELNISGESEDVYGLPVDVSTTALYYNRTALENRGITVISVDEDKMDEWNRGEIADHYGKKKSDYPALTNIEVPAKGFFRDDDYTRKTYGEAEDVSTVINSSVVAATPGTVMIFNDRIPMNWDEIEDIAWLMTNQKGGKSPAPTTKYGFYTEWWFNYGWSVGGDCVVDLSGNGSWAYSHGDRSANYIVAEGKTFEGPITGKTYVAGETIEFLDKAAVSEGDEIRADDKGGYTKNGAAWGPEETVSDTNDTITSDLVKAAVSNGTLIELPSMREAFTRFVNLAGVKDQNLNITPYPSEFSGLDSIRYFTNKNVAFLLERSSKLVMVEDYINNNFDWGVAPIPVFKEYTTPSNELIAEYGSVERANAYNTEVAREGKMVGHSDGIALVIREKSQKKEAAWKFLRWMVSETAQKIRASEGLVPANGAAASAFLAASDPDGSKNLKVFTEAISYETPGDWWYMINNNWINIWSEPLNGQVRNGKMSLADFFQTYIGRGNEEVERYGNYDGELGKVTKK